MICVIPARGGSKRLPGKNTKMLYGRPVIEHVIDACYDSGIFENVIVSTDSADIAGNVSTDSDMRPHHLCGDVSETDVLIDFMTRHGVEEICRVYPFAALLDAQRLRDGYECYKYFGGTVMESTKYEHPVQRAHDGHYYTSCLCSLPSENLAAYYHDAATYMYTTIDELNRNLYDRHITWREVSRLKCQDVDDAEDWEMLKMKFARLHG